MKNFLFLLVIIAFTVLGVKWPNFLNFFYCKPDLLLIFAISLVFYTNFKTALIFAIFAGLAKDVFLPWGFAVNTICFSVWSYVVCRISRQISVEENYVRLAIVLIVALLNNFVVGLQSVSAGNIMPPGIFLRNLLIASIYTTLLSPFVFKLTKRLTR